MSGFSDYTAKSLLNFIVGKSVGAPFSGATAPTGYVGLFTAVTSSDPDAWTSGSPTMTEVSGGSYARVTTSAATWNTSSGSMPSSTSNASAITFPTASGNWGSVIAFGIFDAATAGNLLAWDYLGNYNWFPFSCTSVNTGAGTVITAIGIGSNYGSGWGNSIPVVFDTEYGGSFPTFAGGVNFTNTSSPYYLLTANQSGDTFTVTNGGTAVTTSTAGSGMVRALVAQAINTGVTASFGSGALTLTSA